MNAIFFSFAFALFLGACGLFVGRWNGGGRPAYLKWLDNPFSQILYASVLLAIIWLTQTLDSRTWWLAAITSIFTVVAIVKGHGHNMDLGTNLKPDAKPEWYEFIISRLHGKIPEYWYDALGLAISGMTYTIPAGFYTLNPLLAVSGAVKAPAYMLGRYLYDRWPDTFHRPDIHMDAATAWGESFTCALIWFMAAFPLFALISFYL